MIKNTSYVTFNLNFSQILFNIKILMIRNLIARFVKKVARKIEVKNHQMKHHKNQISQIAE